MAISRTTLTTTKTATASSQTTASVTLAAGDLLVVQVGLTKYSTAQAVTGITWNGNALTKAVSKTGMPSVTSEWHEVSIWYLKVAAGASATVAITCAGSNDVIISAVSKITGHDTTTPIGDTDSLEHDNSSGVEPSLTLTTVSGDLVLDCLQLEDTANETEGAGQTAIYEDADGNNFSGHFSAKTASGTSTTVSWTRALDRGYDYCAAVITAAGGGGGDAGDIFESDIFNSPIFGEE